MSNNRIFTVTEINNYIKNLIQNDVLLSFVYIKGEISNLKIHSSGHIYFTLKDRDSRIKCVMFRGSSSKLKFRPEDGLEIIVRGYFSIYERDGQYQLYAEDMIPEGTGSLYKAYEQLKKKLQEDGVFDTARKKKLPYLPKTVGIITSPTGAAVRDIISIIKRRCSFVHIVLCPVLVQGDGAAEDICRAIRYFNRHKNVDVIIAGRGGGSIEELWAFNEEVVARALFESDIPVVSAVGHETDFTIADFAADLRAPTPSAAAELVVPDYQSLKARLGQAVYMLDSIMSRFIKEKKSHADALSKDNGFRQVERKILNLNQTLDSINKDLESSMQGLIANLKNRLYTNAEKLNILNPEAALHRGYALVKGQDGKLISSVSEASEATMLSIHIKDGVLKAKLCEALKSEAAQ